MTSSRGVLYLLLFSLLTGMSGYVVRQIEGLSLAQIVFFRAALATTFLLSVAIVTGQLKQLRFRMPLLTILMGTVQGISIYLFYAALAKTTLTNAILLNYTAPIFSVILAAIFLKENIEKKTIIAIITAILGVILVSDLSQFSLSSDQTIGSLLAILGGFFYAAMAISSKSLTDQTTPIYAAFWQYFVIMIITSVFAIGTPFMLFTANQLPLLYLGWAAGGIAFLLYMAGVTRVKGQIIQIITMMEVVVASLSGVVLLGERLTFPIILGGLFILSSVIIASYKSSNKS